MLLRPIVLSSRIVHRDTFFDGAARANYSRLPSSKSKLTNPPAARKFFFFLEGYQELDCYEPDPHYFDHLNITVLK